MAPVEVGRNVTLMLQLAPGASVAGKGPYPERENCPAFGPVTVTLLQLRPAARLPPTGQLLFWVKTAPARKTSE